MLLTMVIFSFFSKIMFYRKNWCPWNGHKVKDNIIMSSEHKEDSWDATVMGSVISKFEKFEK